MLLTLSLALAAVSGSCAMRLAPHAVAVKQAAPCVAEPKALGFTAWPQSQGGPNPKDAKDVPAFFCPICVEFSTKSIGYLVQAVEKAGVLGTCFEICQYVPNPSLAQVCVVACEFVGIEEFSKILERVDIDPYLLCDLTHLCPTTEGGAVTNVAVTVNPAPVPEHSTFTIALGFTVTKALGAGQFHLKLTDDSGDSEDVFATHNGFPAATSAAEVSFTYSTDDVGLGPGTYTADMAICQGECDSKHEHSVNYGLASKKFTVTKHD
jgi:hypothetical protein